ncbi:hypothetical protein ACNOYE_39940 [Nannocystaceae bacterium ST9]
MILPFSAALTVVLAFAAPEGDPVVQRPKASNTAPPTNPPLFPEADAAPVDPPSDPAPEPSPDPSVDPAPLQDPNVPTSESAEPVEPEPDEEEIANLLDSDEPEVERRAATPPPTRDRVDHAERMRGYYASIYRPRANPARVWFAARGAYSLTGNAEAVGGGRMGFASVEAGQTWNWLGYGLGATLMAGSLTFGEEGVAKSAGVLIGGGPSLGLGRLALLGRGYVDLRVGYNFFYAPVQTTRAGLADPIDASPHGPKVQLDIGLMLHDSESRRFRHGLAATLGWQMLVHSFTGEYPRLNSFNVGIGYFFG